MHHITPPSSRTQIKNQDFLAFKSELAFFGTITANCLKFLHSKGLDVAKGTIRWRPPASILGQRSILFECRLA